MEAVHLPTGTGLAADGTIISNAEIKRIEQNLPTV
jgi:hypothetical protein